MVEGRDGEMREGSMAWYNALLFGRASPAVLAVAVFSVLFVEVVVSDCRHLRYRRGHRRRQRLG